MRWACDLGQRKNWTRFGLRHNRLIRESIFMKDHITTCKNFMTGEIVKLIGFLTNRITDENAHDCSWGKFVCDLDICSKG